MQNGLMTNSCMHPARQTHVLQRQHLPTASASAWLLVSFGGQHPIIIFCLSLNANYSNLNLMPASSTTIDSPTELSCVVARLKSLSCQASACHAERCPRDSDDL